MNLAFYVRTQGDPGSVLSTLRAQIRAIDPNVTVFDPVPLKEFIGASLYPQKVAASLMSRSGGWQCCSPRSVSTASWPTGWRSARRRSACAWLWARAPRRPAHGGPPGAGDDQPGLGGRTSAGVCSGPQRGQRLVHRRRDGLERQPDGRLFHRSARLHGGRAIPLCNRHDSRTAPRPPRRIHRPHESTKSGVVQQRARIRYALSSRSQPTINL